MQTRKYAAIMKSIIDKRRQMTREQAIIKSTIPRIKRTPPQLGKISKRKTARARQIFSNKSISFLVINPEAYPHIATVLEFLRKEGLSIIHSKSFVYTPSQLNAIYSKEIATIPDFKIKLALLENGVSRVLVVRGKNALARLNNLKGGNRRPNKRTMRYAINNTNKSVITAFSEKIGVQKDPQKPWTQYWSGVHTPSNPEQQAQHAATILTNAELEKIAKKN